MIGIFDYTVILTYAGLLCTLLGIQQAVEGYYINAILCLGGTLFCDMMDGKVARTKKNRTDRERMFGIQIDSLCDLVSFGVFPSVLCYMLGLQGWIGFLVIGYYCLCCVIRLAYFNVLEMDRSPEEKSVYHGLPAIGLAVLLPAICMVRLWIPEETLVWILRMILPLLATLYILDFKVNKPSLLQLLLLSLVFWIPFAVICFGQ